MFYDMVPVITSLSVVFFFLLNIVALHFLKRRQSFSHGTCFAG